MLTKRERYLRTVRGEETDRPPVWIMRQAGRYMPEYMELRKRHEFRELCLIPEASVAASLLPLRLLDIDILIIFNDIMIPLEEMGLPVTFPQGGPRIAQPLRTEADLSRFHAADFDDPPVCRSLRRLKEQAGPDVPALGFAGAPFTLACYAVEGAMSKNKHVIMEMVYREPELLERFLERIADTAANYLIAQIKQGHADGVQLFESWAGLLAPTQDYERFAAKYQRMVIGKVKAACPDTPVHLFAKGSCGLIEAMDASGADVLSVDWSLSLADARRRTGKCLQGNLDPVAMHVPEAVPRLVSRMLEDFDWRRRWIANLGHGILPQAQVEGARAFVQAIQALGR
ncbi:uroporphyrinogen decarboxylase [Candidatus Sumerlaeota bacterium]|nr:uroporphyrinogen decarboxylase [Candidatus Sumerlaeota bacterium]